jgi:hypothetical protein
MFVFVEVLMVLGSDTVASELRRCPALVFLGFQKIVQI